MVERFNALARRGNVELEAWFSTRTEPDRSWRVDEAAWSFPHRFLPRLAVGRYGAAMPLPLLLRQRPDVFVTLHARAEFLTGWALAKARGSRTAFWVLPTYDAWVRRRPWKEALKRQIFPRTDAILTSGDDGRAFAKRYHAPDDRILVVPQVIDVPHFGKARLVTPDRRETMRAALGVAGTTFVYVGRLWSGKGLAYLIDAFGIVQRHEDVDATLLLVGDGVDEEALRAYAGEKAGRSIVFAGFRTTEELPDIYAASDVLVFPTLGDPYGLVVDEAMAAGLPVISTTAAGEITARVRDGETGYLVEPASEDQLANRMLLMARDGVLRRRMAAAAASSVEGRTPELWADTFERAIEAITSMPRLRGARRRRRPGENRGVDTRR